MVTRLLLTASLVAALTVLAAPAAALADPGGPNRKRLSR